jgi:hypothetical protein
MRSSYSEISEISGYYLREAIEAPALAFDLLKERRLKGAVFLSAVWLFILLPFIAVGFLFAALRLGAQKLFGRKSPVHFRP